ncbi:MAG: hypothetical protein AAF391_03700 [Bacteroidota bacterium]
MIKLIISITILFTSQSIFSQPYEVLDAKKVTTFDGKRVKKGSYLNRTDSIAIAEKGYLTLDVESAMHLKLAPGNYQVGKEAKRLNAWYNTHLGLTKLLKSKNLIMCKFRYKTLAVPGSNRHYEVDRIEIDQKPLVTIKSDTAELKLSWANPEYKFNGKYYIIVRDFYNHGFIDVLETEEDSIILYPGRYRHKHMYYSVLASNCRASLRHKIQVLLPDAVSYDRTDFVNESSRQ